MNTNNNAPTFEEFKKATSECLAPLVERARRARNGGLTTAEYMETEEAKSVLKNNYKSNLRKFNEGRITRKGFLERATASTADCLSMLY